MELKDIRPALRAFLVADATIAGLVKTGSVTRIYPGRMPQGQALTSVVYSEISGQGDNHSQGPSGLARVRMQIAAWSTTADVAHALYLAIKNRIDGFGPGAWGSGATLVNVQGVFLDSWRDIEDTEANLVGKAADYFINYEER
jgi:hypothetical protein